MEYDSRKRLSSNRYDVYLDDTFTGISYEIDISDVVFMPYVNIYLHDEEIKSSLFHDENESDIDLFLRTEIINLIREIKLSELFNEK